MLQAVRLRQISMVWVYLFFCVLLAVLFVASIAIGSVSLEVNEVIAALGHGLSHSLAAESQNLKVDLIVNQIRLPRALLATLVGALLAISGAATQGLFRNPLADPSLIGVTAGATMGASLVIVLGSSLMAGVFAGLWEGALVTIGAGLGGAIAVWLVYRLATDITGTSVATMLLAGIAITALASCVTSLLRFFADNDMLRRISLWQMGGLDGANYERLLWIAVIALVVVLLLPRYSTALNALLLGESEARHLGIDVERVKRNIVLLVAAAVGVSVALSGVIVFVGLVVPHMVRMIIGPDHRHLLPLSALAGSIMLLAADLIARTVISPIELPVGVVTSIIGSPIFIVLLKQRQQYGMGAA